MALTDYPGVTPQMMLMAPAEHPGAKAQMAAERLGVTPQMMLVAPAEYPAATPQMASAEHPGATT